MNSVKAPMSASYKAVFALSILMIFFVIIGGAMSGSKSVGFGVWYWGYTAWKMYKRDNDSLISLQKIMLWFEAIAFSVALAVLLFSDNDVRRYVDVSIMGLIIVGSVSMLITYILFVFFKKQTSAGLISGFSGQDDTTSIDDKYWEAASIELSLKRNEAAWAKSFAMSEGDDAKAKAMYIKNRALDLMKADLVLVVPAVSAPAKNEHIVVMAPAVFALENNEKSSAYSEIPLFWNSFNLIGKIAIFGIVGLIAYALIADDDKKNGTTLTKNPTSISINRGSSWQSNVSELQRGISDGVFPVKIMSAEVIVNEFDIFDKPWNHYRATLPSNLVNTVEEKNIWWSEDGRFYIRLYNPSGANLLGFNFSITGSKCSNSSSSKTLINFDLKDGPLMPYSYGIYSANWPFDYSKVIGSGTKCGTITTVLTSK